ncbi:unnamed protein product [Urochloa humidicola]
MCIAAEEPQPSAAELVVAPASWTCPSAPGHLSPRWRKARRPAGLVARRPAAILGLPLSTRTPLTSLPQGAAAVGLCARCIFPITRRRPRRNHIQLKTEEGNEELWNEARTYGVVQLMVDYYSLILWKTIAICMYGINVLSAKYVMKADDDAFVRVEEILSSLDRRNISHGIL